jgi:hypothetical protein
LLSVELLETQESHQPSNRTVKQHHALWIVP